MTARLAQLCLNEQRSRDFTARLTHKGMRGHRAKAQRKKARLAAALMGLAALPAFSANPNALAAFRIGDAIAHEAGMDPMPFERKGESFPGSAFYYLDLEANPAPAAYSAIATEIGSVFQNEPAARPLRVDNSGIDRLRAEQCLTAAIYYEAASEADAGQRAVAQVVLNRVAHPAYPNTVCGVVFQGSERTTGCQFTFTCDGSLARRPQRLFWDRAANVARQALAGYVYTPAGLATHYHTLAVHPYWASSLRYMLTIGAHRFYSFNGAAGKHAVFRFAYLGGEPTPGPRPRQPAPAQAGDTSIDPVDIQQVFDRGAMQADRSAASLHTGAPTAAPLYTNELTRRGGDALYSGDNLPGGHEVRDEYRNSGQWIASPVGSL
ncbi:cell wall hydrolase [Novosphingobium sp. M1R2S20]|uniref:Cell wall hydrolase n=1 Tax=Novosphingobium rhizovicinum TaxID=3228928 RepID=A0ABV3RCT7_9SPHN